MRRQDGAPRGLTKHVAAHYGLGWNTVKDIDKTTLETELGPPDLDGVELLANRVEKEAVAPGPDTAVRSARVVVTASEPSLALSTTPQSSAAGGAPATLGLETSGEDRLVSLYEVVQIGLQALGRPAAP